MVARQLRGRALNQGLLVVHHTQITNEAEGCSERVWRTQCRALLICPARSSIISLPPLDPYPDIHQLQRARPLQCYLWLSHSRGSPTWYRGSLCVPGRPAEEAGSSCHLIPTHGISCLRRNNFFPFPNRDSKSSSSLAATTP